MIPAFGRITDTVITAALLATVGWIYFRVATPVPLVRFQVTLPGKTAFSSGSGGTTAANSGTIWPDGTRMVFVATDVTGKTLLWARSLDAVAPQPLSGTENPAFPLGSPDSRFIGFLILTWKPQ
jgi:hypothetical protein